MKILEFKKTFLLLASLGLLSTPVIIVGAIRGSTLAPVREDVSDIASTLSTVSISTQAPKESSPPLTAPIALASRSTSTEQYIPTVGISPIPTSEEILPHHLLAQSDDAQGLHSLLHQRLEMGLFQRHEKDDSLAMWSVCEQNTRGWTILHHAVNKRRPENIKIIKATLNNEQYGHLLRMQTFNSKQNAVNFAVGINSQEMLNELLDGLDSWTKATFLMKDGTIICSPIVTEYIDATRKEDPEFEALVAFIKNGTIFYKHLTSLQRAARFGSLDHIQEIFEHHSPSSREHEVCWQNIYGRTALHEAVDGNHFEAVRIMCSKLSQENLDSVLGMKDITGHSPLTSANNEPMRDLLKSFQVAHMQRSRYSPEPISVRQTSRKAPTPGYMRPTITSRMNAVGDQSEAFKLIFQRWYGE